MLFQFHDTICVPISEPLLRRCSPNPRGHRLALLFSLAVVLLAGCNRDPKKFLAKGNQSFDQGKYPDALIYYGRALQLDPRFAEAHFKLAETHLKMKSWASGFSELQRTVELQPDNWKAQLELGQLQLAAGHANEAKDRAQMVLKANPNDVEAQMLLADSDSALGNTKMQSRRPAKRSSCPGTRRNISESWRNFSSARGRYQKTAKTNLLKAQSLDPKAVASYMMLGSLYFQEKRPTDAEQQFKAAIAQAPNDPAPRAALAGMYAALRARPTKPNRF